MIYPKGDPTKVFLDEIFIGKCPDCGRYNYTFWDDLGEEELDIQGIREQKICPEIYCPVCKQKKKTKIKIYFDDFSGFFDIIGEGYTDPNNPNREIVSKEVYDKYTNILKEKVSEYKKDNNVTNLGYW